MESVARQEGRAVSHTACGSPKGVNSRPDGGWGARCGVVRKNDSGRRETEEREEPEWKRGTTRRGCSTHNPVDSAAYYTGRWAAGVCEDNTKPCYLAQSQHRCGRIINTARRRRDGRKKQVHPRNAFCSERTSEQRAHRQEYLNLPRTRTLQRHKVAPAPPGDTNEPPES